MQEGAGLGREGVKARLSLCLPQAVTASWPALLEASALEPHGFLPSGMCSCCRQRDLSALGWAAAFGSDLRLKKAANQGKSEALFSSIPGHPLSEPRKWDLAKLRRSGTEVGKDGGQHDGGWLGEKFPHPSQLGGLSATTPRGGLAKPSCCSVCLAWQPLPVFV